MCRGVWWGGRQVTERGEGSGASAVCCASGGALRARAGRSRRTGSRGVRRGSAAGCRAEFCLLLALVDRAGLGHARCQLRPTPCSRASTAVSPRRSRPPDAAPSAPQPAPVARPGPPPLLASSMPSSASTATPASVTRRLERLLLGLMRLFENPHPSLGAGTDLLARFPSRRHQATTRGRRSGPALAAQPFYRVA